MQLDVYKLDATRAPHNLSEMYDYVGAFGDSGTSATKILRLPEVARALGEGEHVVMAQWPGQYALRYRVAVPAAQVTVTQL